MKRFIFSLPDDLSDRIEGYRRERGLKATAEAVRVLIERGLGSGAGPVAAPVGPKSPSPGHVGSKTVVVSTKRRAVEAVSPRAVARDALTGEPISPRAPYQKTGKR